MQNYTHCVDILKNLKKLEHIQKLFIEYQFYAYIFYLQIILRHSFSAPGQFLELIDVCPRTNCSKTS